MASLLSVTFEPVMLEHVRDHAFEKRMSSGCAICKRAKTHPAHHGSPPSMNVLGSGNQFLYQAIKKWWQPLFTEMFEQADLPRPLAGVLVEGEITFPDRGGVIRGIGVARWRRSSATP
jgi:hypothetical protein